MYHNDYDEKVLARSREPIDMGGRPYVEWSQYTDKPSYTALVWVVSVLIVSLIVWSIITLAA